MAITPALVQQVRHALDIVDIAGDLTTLRRHGRKWQGLCPFHKEKTPSFQVDQELGLYHCFGCGVGGDAIGLYMRQSGDDFPAAIEALARRYGIEIPRETDRFAPPSGPDPAVALEEAQNFFVRQLERTDAARRYLDERQISPELRKRYGLGYAPEGWSTLLDALGRRVPAADLEAVGLVGRSEETGRQYDRFRHRLMFPIHSANGKIVGFGGRTLGDDRAKYVNTSETAFFKKGELIYGLHQAKRAIRESGRAILVEGYFDVLAMTACGLEGAVAGMGTALTPEQTRGLARYAHEVILAYDGDSAGRAAADRALPLLLQAGLVVRRAVFAEGHDPDSLRLAAGPEAVKALLEQAVDAVWLDLEAKIPHGVERDPPAQARAAKAVVEALKPIRDRMVRDGYARRAAQRLGVDPGVLLRREGLAELDRVIQKPGLVRIDEEEVVVHLLDPGQTAPRPEQLPPSEVFEDESCRNLYASFCLLYRSGGRRPAVEEVVEILVEDGKPIDQVARILLEDRVPRVDGGPLYAGLGELEARLGRIYTRWAKRRLAELQNEIMQASADPDSPHLQELLEEKLKLIRHFQPSMDGTYLGGLR